jgi:hypothetical protein
MNQIKDKSPQMQDPNMYRQIVKVKKEKSAMNRTRQKTKAATHVSRHNLTF